MTRPAAGGVANPRLWRVVFPLALVVGTVLALKPAGDTPPLFMHADKLQHLLAFAALWGLGRAAGVAPLALAVGLLAYGGLIEALQSLTPTREASWADVAANAAGLVLGHIVTTRWRPLGNVR